MNCHVLKMSNCVFLNPLTRNWLVILPWDLLPEIWPWSEWTLTFDLNTCDLNTCDLWPTYYDWPWPLAQLLELLWLIALGEYLQLAMVFLLYKWTFQVVLSSFKVYKSSFSTDLICSLIVVDRINTQTHQMIVKVVKNDENLKKCIIKIWTKI